MSLPFIAAAEVEQRLSAAKAADASPVMQEAGCCKSRIAAVSSQAALSLFPAWKAGLPAG
jgi:hypothetical protein